MAIDKKWQGAANSQIGNDTPPKRWESLGFLIILVLSFSFLFLHYKGIKAGEISQGKSLVRFLTIFFITLLVFQILSRVVPLFFILGRRHKGEATMVVRFLRALTGLAIVLVIIESMGKITAFGAIGAGFAGMLFGWSLQAPVSGIAAWILVTVRRPFRIGDRIQFPALGLVGDVVDMGAMYMVLNQVGGSVGTEEATNRAILIPNAMLFSQVGINYTSGQEASSYILDEVVIRITYDSDWDVVEKILLDAAREVTADIIEKTGSEPYIRSDMYDYGIYLRLRYMTEAMERPRIAHEINKRICREFQMNPKVDFAIPFVYSYRAGEKEKDAG